MNPTEKKPVMVSPKTVSPPGEDTEASAQEPIQSPGKTSLRDRAKEWGDQLKLRSKHLPRLLLIDHHRFLENIIVVCLALLAVYFMVTIHFQQPSADTVAQNQDNPSMPTDKLQNVQQWVENNRRHVESGLELRGSTRFTAPTTNE